ncbi:MAG: 2-amino-4-hydroxy-6-hydroxymethyldihydropteridine diphosphokinase [Desulfomonile sp.]|nr:2-amino-4-hydroxy-6-hydroxymethyldihydropteridine diphosphokinase [Desulfomonile sp.]
MTVDAYIGFGSNMGDRETMFNLALAALSDLPATVVIAWSRLYETEPVGLTDNGSEFLNAAIAVRTTLSPHQLMDRMRMIEQRLGKSPHHRSDQSRMIDLDLLLYDNRRLREEALEIPHPRMHLRAFVLAPLSEIAAHVIHPVLGISVQQLLTRLPSEDLVGVRPLESVPVSQIGKEIRCGG